MNTVESLLILSVCLLYIASIREHFRSKKEWDQIAKGLNEYRKTKNYSERESKEIRQAAKDTLKKQHLEKYQKN